MCNKTSKTIEYCKIFLRWIIKRAHGITRLDGYACHRISSFTPNGLTFGTQGETHEAIVHVEAMIFHEGYTLLKAARPDLVF
jgi:hypothetical protein